VNWVELAIDGLQALCVEVFGAAFGEADQEDIIDLIGKFWYAAKNKNKTAMQAMNNYPTTYWLDLYENSNKVFFFFFFIFLFFLC
jgi:hypothetical protein